MSPENSHDDLTGSCDTDSEFAAFERQVAHVSYVRPGPPLPRVGQIIAGKYRVNSLLGRGGMGAVFSVTHQLTQRLFAIKWLLPNLAEQPDAVQRFWREARAAGKIMHPNVVQVYDIGQEGASHYILMELIQGVTLSDRLRQRGRFEPTEACRVLIPVMRGLHAAHLAGVVHRDLKPQNIMLSTHADAGEGEDMGVGMEIPKVLDFGISKIISHAGEQHSSATRRGAIIGTPHYMPLEQLRSAQVDARTDVYALGVIAYHMLSGALPFSSTNHADLVCQILGREATPLNERAPSLPRELIAVIDKAMSPDPAERFASVAALARALEPFADGMTFAAGGEREREAGYATRGQAQAGADEAGLESSTPKISGLSNEQTPLVAESEYRHLRGAPLSKRVHRALAIAAVGVVAPLLAVVGYNAASRVHEARETTPLPAHAATAAPPLPATATNARPLAQTVPEAPEMKASAADAPKPAEATVRAMTADWQTPTAEPATDRPRQVTRVNARTNGTNAGQSPRVTRSAPSPRALSAPKPPARAAAPLETNGAPEIRGADFH